MPQLPPLSSLSMITKTAGEQVFQLLELQELITAHLNIGDLLQCVQVSRGWYQVFASVLWGSCNDQKRPWHRILQCAVPLQHQPDASLTEDRRQDAILVLEKLGPFVRELSSQQYYTVHLFLDLHRKHENLPNRRPQLQSIYLSLVHLWERLRHDVTLMFSPSTDMNKDVPTKALFDLNLNWSQRTIQMVNQIRACWQLIIYHQSSLRIVDFTSGASIDYHMLCVNPPFRLATPLHVEKRDVNAVEMEKETASSLFTRSLSQASEGARFLAKALQSMPRLQHLRLDAPRDYSLNALPIINHCGHGALQSLDFREQSFNDAHNPNSYSSLLLNKDNLDDCYRVLVVNPRIRRLRIGSVSSKLMAMLVQDVFPYLEYFHAERLQELIEHPGDEIDSRPLATLSENRTLKTLRIETGRLPMALMKVPIQWMALTTLEYPIMTLSELPALLERMPKIKSVSHINSHKDQHLHEVLVVSRLSEVGLQSQQKPWQQSLEHFGTPGMLAAPYGHSALLHLLPQMINVTRLHLGRIEKDVLKCMANSPLPLLEEFILDIRQSCSVDITTLVMTTYPRLKILRGQGLAMRVINACQKPWVCTNLRELQCLIVGVPRLSAEQMKMLDEGPPEVPNGKIENWEKDAKDAWTLRHVRYNGAIKLKERSKAVQRQTYAQLARLQQLRVLDVGDTSPRSDDCTLRENSLDFSLENGLNQLRELRNLRVLGIKNLDLRVQEKEAEWVVEHWPNFAMLKGCASKAWIATTKKTDNERKAVPEMDVVWSLRPLVRRLKQLKPSVVLCNNEYSAED